MSNDSSQTQLFTALQDVTILASSTWPSRCNSIWLEGVAAESGWRVDEEDPDEATCDLIFSVSRPDMNTHLPDIPSLDEPPFEIDQEAVSRSVKVFAEYLSRWRATRTLDGLSLQARECSLETKDSPRSTPSRKLADFSLIDQGGIAVYLVPARLQVVKKRS